MSIVVNIDKDAFKGMIKKFNKGEENGIYFDYSSQSIVFVSNKYDFYVSPCYTWDEFKAIEKYIELNYKYYNNNQAYFENPLNCYKKNYAVGTSFSILLLTFLNNGRNKVIKQDYSV